MNNTAPIKVRALRELHNLNHGELAQLAGIPSPSQISRIESGRNHVSSVEMRVRLAQGFGLTLQEMHAYLEGRMSVEEAYTLGRPRMSHRLRELRKAIDRSRCDEVQEAIAICGGATKLGPVVPVVQHLAASGVEQTVDGWIHTIKYFSGKISQVLSQYEVLEKRASSSDK